MPPAACRPYTPATEPDAKGYMDLVRRPDWSCCMPSQKWQHVCMHQQLPLPKDYSSQAHSPLSTH